MLNQETHFDEIPEVDIQRSVFDRSASHKTAFSTGQLIPLLVDEILPGDSVTLDFSHVTRMTTPIAPVMDNCVLDVYAFVCPNRLVWTHWPEYWGENNSTHWEQPVEYEVPTIDSPAGGWDVGSLADYMGIPTGVTLEGINHLPFRVYAKIINDWFRDENLKDPCYITMDETSLTGVNKGLTYDYVTDTELGAAPFTAAKLADYFTKALPAPQKGPSVTLPLGKNAPVIVGDLYEYSPDAGMLFLDASTGKALKRTNNEQGLLGTIGLGTGDEDLPAYGKLFTQSGATLTPQKNPIPGNLWADLSEATAATISDLRAAFAVQRFFEAQSRGGSRYIEFLQNIFHVTSPDARQQRSEFIGAKRFPINVDQVLQTSATDNVTPQGNTAAFSCTVNADDLATYSSTEHAYLMVLGVIRTNHSYQQGLEKMWSRKKWSDWYLPQFANLSEMPILNKEIYAQGTNTDDEVFGYQEAWAEYRYKPNRISGKLRSQATGTLDIWHYGDYYTSLPYLSSDWIDETDANVARTLAVQNEPQFIMDCYISSKWTRPMPMFSVPGLLDHH